MADRAADRALARRAHLAAGSVRDFRWISWIVHTGAEQTAVDSAREDLSSRATNLVCACPSCQKRNPQGVWGGPIDWNATTFDPAFKAKARRDNGFVFTAYLRTSDCGASFYMNAEFVIEGLDD